MTTRLIFFGGGNMAEAIFAGLVSNSNYSITVIQRNPTKAETLKAKYQNITIKSTLDFTPGENDIVFLAIKPQQAKEALLPIKALLTQCTIISVMAGLAIETIQAWIGNEKIIRTMPNTPSSIGKGVTAIYSPNSIRQEHRDLCINIFNNIGSIYVAKDETEIDKIAPFSSSSIAFTYYFIEGFIKSAVEQFGFEKQDAQKFIAESMIGACELLVSDNEHSIEEQRARVTSKKGMTEQGVIAFEKHNLHAIINDATQKCYARAIEMSNEFK